MKPQNLQALKIAMLLLVLVTGISSQTCEPVDNTTDAEANKTQNQYVIEGDGNGTGTICTCPDITTVSNNSCVCIKADSFFNGVSCECKFGFREVNGVCVGCPFPCFECTDASVCVACEPGYVLDEGLCTTVAQGVLGFYFINGTIAECPAGCSDCTSAGCTACADAYYLKGTLCYPCSAVGDYCLTCSATACTACYPGHYVASGKCAACPANCETCTSTACSACSDGFYASGNSCIACEPGCDQCTSTGCSACSRGFAMVVAGECTECISGCNLCSPSDITNCLGCVGNYFSLNGVCTACLPTCITCMDAEDVCTSCVEGYQLNGTDCNPTCVFPCNLCSIEHPDWCSFCYAGYEQFGVYCEANVTACNADSNCEGCPRGFTLSNSKCVKCTKANCINCAPDQTCLRCNVTYGLVAGSCASCPTGCSLCDNGKICTECTSGFYLEKSGNIITGDCLACDATRGCATCHGSADNCLTCAEGWEFLGSKCVTVARIDFYYLLDVEPSEFMTKTNDFKDALLGRTGKGWGKLQRYLVTLTSILAGSTAVNGTVSLVDPTADDSDIITAAIADANAQETSIAGMTVLASEVGATASTNVGNGSNTTNNTNNTNGTDGNDTTNPTDEGGNNTSDGRVGRIVGFSILGAAILIAIIVGVALAAKSRRQSQYEQPRESDEYLQGRGQVV